MAMMRGKTARYRVHNGRIGKVPTWRYRFAEYRDAAYYCVREGSRHASSEYTIRVPYPPIRPKPHELGSYGLRIRTAPLTTRAYSSVAGDATRLRNERAVSSAK